MFSLLVLHMIRLFVGFIKSNSILYNQKQPEHQDNVMEARTDSTDTSDDSLDLSSGGDSFNIEEDEMSSWIKENFLTPLEKSCDSTGIENYRHESINCDDAEMYGGSPNAIHIIGSQSIVSVYDSDHIKAVSEREKNLLGHVDTPVTIKNSSSLCDAEEYLATHKNIAKLEDLSADVQNIDYFKTTEVNSPVLCEPTVLVSDYTRKPSLEDMIHISNTQVQSALPSHTLASYNAGNVCSLCASCKNTEGKCSPQSNIESHTHPLHCEAKCLNTYAELNKIGSEEPSIEISSIHVPSNVYGDNGMPHNKSETTLYRERPYVAHNVAMGDPNNEVEMWTGTRKKHSS